MGSVVVGLRPSLPVKKVDLILGIDIRAGGLMSLILMFLILMKLSLDCFQPVCVMSWKVMDQTDSTS